MAMSFQKQVKYVNIALVAISVLLLFLLLNENNLEMGTETLEADFNEPSLDIPRSYLIFWEFVWLLTIGYGFFWLAKRAASKANEENEHKLEAFEPKFFKIMIVVLITAAFFTLLVPALYGDQSAVLQFRNSDDAVEVEVVAYQFYFTFDGNTSITLIKGVKYVFVLTTADTTHGFGLYNNEDLLLGQAQIVPEYETEFVWKFSDTGVYSVRCMEYCGIAHDAMYQPGTITVTA